MKDNNYVRFCCSNHVRENIKKAFGKKTGNDFKRAVLSHERGEVDRIIETFPPKLKAIFTLDVRKEMFLSYIDDDTHGLTIHTNNNTESTNNKHKGGRSFNVIYAINDMIKRDCVTHNITQIGKICMII